MRKQPWAVWSGDSVLASEFCNMDENSALNLVVNYKRKGIHNAEARPARYQHLWGTTITNAQWAREQEIRKAAHPTPEAGGTAEWGELLGS